VIAPLSRGWIWRTLDFRRRGGRDGTAALRAGGSFEAVYLWVPASGSGQPAAEAETRRNVQVMWLINRLTPSFKTIADFPQGPAEAIVKVCRAFIGFCREQSCSAPSCWIDGTGSRRWRAASRTPKRIEQMNAAIDRKIADYLASMDEADREEPAAAGKPPTWRLRLKSSRPKKSGCKLRRRIWRRVGSSRRS